MFSTFIIICETRQLYMKTLLLVRRIKNYELHKMLISSTTWNAITLIKFKIQEKFAFTCLQLFLMQHIHAEMRALEIISN